MQPKSQIKVKQGALSGRLEVCATVINFRHPLKAAPSTLQNRGAIKRVGLAYHTTHAAIAYNGEGRILENAQHGTCSRQIREARRP